MKKAHRMIVFCNVGFARRLPAFLLGIGLAAASPGLPAAAAQKCFKAHNPAEVAASVAAPRNAATPCLNFMVITNPGDPNFNQLLGINNTRNEIVGYFGDGNLVANSGYLVVPQDHFASENPNGATQTQVFGIDNEVIPTTVGFFQDANGNQFGFINSKGAFTTVQNPMSGTFNGVTTNQLLGIDADPETNFVHLTVGFFNDSAGNAHADQYDPVNKIFGNFAFPASTFPNLVSSMATGIHTGAFACGLWVDKSGVTRGWLGQNGGTLVSINPPAPFVGLTLAGLNANGIVVGFVTDAAGGNHGYVLNGNTGQFYIMDAPGSSQNTTAAIDNLKGTMLNGIDINGDIVGFFSDGTKLHGLYATLNSGTF